MNPSIARVETDTSDQDAAIGRLFEDARKRLVETGTRNRLIHVNRQNRRANALEIINERSNDIYSLLVSTSKTMRFLATGKDQKDDSDTPSLAEADDGLIAEERYVDNHLETRLGPDGLQKRLLKLARDAKAVEEEQGVNVLFLAMGFLSWFEDEKSEVKREAPLLLLPVELIRNAKSSTYDLRARDEDISTNLPFQERLRNDFGISLPEVIIEDGWTPERYFDEVARTVAAKKRWSIDRDGMQLGFFSFAKLLMFRDLDPANWPEASLETHPLVKGLLYERFPEQDPLFNESDRLDEKLSPESLFHVVDADSSQTKVIEEVRSGRNLVVQGPPGTGKSQTITNIIAAAVKDGKRVLFVAEKMAALGVVHHRLVRSGLSDICLELHSRGANKKVVLAELANTLNAARQVPAHPPVPAKLRDSRDRLNTIAANLHRTIGTTGETAFDSIAMQASFVGRNVAVPKTDSDELAQVDRADAARIANAIEMFGHEAATIGALVNHPFYGTHRLDLQPTELARIVSRLKDALDAVSRLRTMSRSMADALGITPPSTTTTVFALLDQAAFLKNPPACEDALLVTLIEAKDKIRLREILTEGVRWSALHEEGRKDFVEAAWDFDAASIRPGLAAGRQSFLARMGGAYRQASRALAGLLIQPLPGSAAARTDLADRLIAASESRGRWGSGEIMCAKAFDVEWKGERTDFSGLLAALNWAEQASKPQGGAPAIRLVSFARQRPPECPDDVALADVAEQFKARMSVTTSDLLLDPGETFGGSDLQECDLAIVETKLRGMVDRTEDYESWMRLQRLRTTLEEAGCSMLLEELATGRLTGEAAKDQFLYARSEALWRRAVDEDSALAALREDDRHHLADEFRRLEVDRRRETVQAVLATHLSQVPLGAQGAIGIVRSEIGKKKAHAPIRKFFSLAGEAIQRIKPVLMMSPISVAQYLPPGSVTFDLLLIDEASQVRPEDALGVIARARQIVVVGDQKQLPPSSFFDRLSSGDGDEHDEDSDDLLEGNAKVGDLESILTLCEARGLPGRMLEWHYRSRDPSLIRVSNREFYQDRLILPPSPLQGHADYGLKFTQVAGLYDRGGKRDNRIEAEAVVERVAEHASRTPELTLGIATFSLAQRNVITELLEHRRRRDPALDHFLREEGGEEVFVKSIENVQGDERDVILVSVGYGPSTLGGKPAMSFGPVNGEGGERRLNVLFTRSRVRCEIFCSFDPTEMDVSKTQQQGPKVFKRYLDFAKTGRIDDAILTNGDADSPLEADIASEIRRLGYLVDHQVGSSGFLIDLGVRHPDRPGTYLLAVECDGATYHSALWARERDRLRQEVLEHLGWRFHRIWSTDWFYRRADELERLRRVLESAYHPTAPDDASSAVKRERARPIEPARPVLESIRLEPQPGRVIPFYRRTLLDVHSREEPHEAATERLVPLVRKIVEVEGPVYYEEVARRVAAAFGKDKAGSRIVTATLMALQAAKAGDAASIQDDQGFWFTPEQAAEPPVRDRSHESAPTTKPLNISPMEIAACLKLAIDDTAGGSDQEIIRCAARLFGYKRVGADLQFRLQSCLESIQR